MFIPPKKKKHVPQNNPTFDHGPTDLKRTQLPASRRVQFSAARGSKIPYAASSGDKKSRASHSSLKDLSCTDNIKS